MTKKRSGGLVIGFSILLLLGLFIGGLKLMTEHIDIQTIETEYTGKIQFIPTLSTTGNNTIEMKLRYITVARNINLNEYIYEHDESAIIDKNHTMIYKLSLTSVEGKTRIYKIEKIINGTFIRVLEMSQGVLKTLVTPSETIYEGQHFTTQVIVKDEIVYLWVTQKSEVGESKT